MGVESGWRGFGGLSRLCARNKETMTCGGRTGYPAPVEPRNGTMNACSVILTGGKTRWKKTKSVPRNRPHETHLLRSLWRRGSSSTSPSRHAVRRRQRGRAESDHALRHLPRQASRARDEGCLSPRPAHTGWYGGRQGQGKEIWRFARQRGSIAHYSAAQCGRTCGKGIADHQADARTGRYSAGNCRSIDRNGDRIEMDANEGQADIGAIEVRPCCLTAQHERPP